MWHVIKEDQIYFDNSKIGKLARLVFSSHFKLVSTDPARQTTLSHFLLSRSEKLFNGVVSRSHLFSVKAF